MKKIGLLGGSFDPIHDGHMLLAKTAYRQLKLNEVWFIPVLNNPFKERQMAPAKDRVAMIELALRKEKHFHVQTIELQQDPQKKSYTYRTLQALKEKYPDVQFYYLVGMDQVEKFDRWYEAEKISQMVQLVAMARKGYAGNTENEKKFHMQRLVCHPLKASSTAIRQGHFKHVDDKVIEYLTMHGLYLEEIVQHMMSEKRFKHTQSMAHLAKDIAQANQIDPLKAYVAGMLHDIAKEMEPNKALKLMQKHYPKYVTMPPAVWHQWLSCRLAKKKFHVHDKEILNAIKHHTTGCTHMGPLDMCIYVADKYDPSRGFDSQKQIALCKKDLKAGFIASLEDFYRFSQEKNRPIDPVFYKIYQTYKESNHE